MLNHDIWSKQDEILQSIANSLRTAVKACHASGKTFVAAADASRTPSLGRDPRHGEPVEDCLSETSSHKATPWPQPLRHRAVHERGCFFQGFHGNVLIALDEASGVLPEI
jgi:hypothetical protein